MLINLLGLLLSFGCIIISATEKNFSALIGWTTAFLLWLYCFLNERERR